MYSNSKRKHNLSLIEKVDTSKRANTTIATQEPTSNRFVFMSKISQIPNIKSYVGIQKLKLSQNALQKIRQSLDIEHLSQLSYQERVKVNNFYINYERNPFIKESKNNPTEVNQRQKQNNRGHKDQNIVESISRLKEKTEFQNIMNRLVKEDSESNYVHMKMKDAARNQEISRKMTKYANKEPNEKENFVREDKVLTPFEDFDRIINLKEENFYNKHNKNKTVNIFKILTDPMNDDLYFTFAKLKKVYFCEDLTISKTNAKKITNVFKDISYVSRLFIKDSYNKVPKDYRLVPADMKCILEQINYVDVMNLASGIIQPEVLEGYLYEEVRNTGKKGGDDQGSSLVEDEEQIWYDDNQENKSTDFRVQRHDKAQIEAYIHHAFSKVQQKQLILSQIHKEKLMKFLNLEKQCKSTNIRDNKLLREINEKKKEILASLYEEKIKKQSGSIDKVIRLNKRNKDRIENVKNKIVIETVQKVKQIEKQIRSSSRQGSSLSKWR